ncbi:MAG: HAD-IA family hydrolase [Candidatus Omnitrophica bacterium]|nr:HAD-IA family hydrolase [Candidatus Omnitrophota bacterium]
MRIDTVFFDVDGTLVDATRDITNSVNHALRALKMPELSREKVVSYIGTGVRDLLRQSLSVDDEALVEKAVKLFGDHYVEHAADETVLYPHVIEILEYLKDKRKIILTNRFSSFADATLRGVGIRKYFEEIAGGDDYSCIKPLACAVDGVVGRLGIDKEKALIVGDMDIDVMTGKNSGVKTCWITHGLGRAEEIVPLKPDYIIDDLLELKEIVR